MELAYNHEFSNIRESGAEAEAHCLQVIDGKYPDSGSVVSRKVDVILGGYLGEIDSGGADGEKGRD